MVAVAPDSKLPSPIGETGFHLRASDRARMPWWKKVLMGSALAVTGLYAVDLSIQRWDAISRPDYIPVKSAQQQKLENFQDAIDQLAKRVGPGDIQTFSMNVDGTGFSLTRGMHNNDRICFYDIKATSVSGEILDQPKYPNFACAHDQFYNAVNGVTAHAGGIRGQLSNPRIESLRGLGGSPQIPVASTAPGVKGAAAPMPLTR